MGKCSHADGASLQFPPVVGTRPYPAGVGGRTNPPIGAWCTPPPPDLANGALARTVAGGVARPGILVDWAARALEHKSLILKAAVPVSRSRWPRRFRCRGWGPAALWQELWCERVQTGRRPQVQRRRPARMSPPRDRKRDDAQWEKEGARTPNPGAATRTRAKPGGLSGRAGNVVEAIRDHRCPVVRRDRDRRSISPCSHCRHLRGAAWTHFVELVVSGNLNRDLLDAYADGGHQRRANPFHKYIRCTKLHMHETVR